jgi:hypothetical protein
LPDTPSIKNRSEFCSIEPDSDSKISLAKFSTVSLQKGINFQEEMFRKKGSEKDLK